ncbi:MAG: bifunctional folylpolyglutamate synthase/dihydrofolate synthase [Dysgonamonadaceae bacterium]|jgi:dihydrofolate synthase/folylpolyglutamate synthase|nr:bifunctional folylpolyglutamate synthase/dihydrofolate synthase [Dysgonamonadaceae bacterium]
MTYNETIEYLYNTAPMFHRTGSSAYKEGMENSFAIDRQLGHPHTKYKTIHIGGTNGKGSTSHLLASILQEAGYKTGLYTSPHLLDFRERIRVNGNVIEKDFVIAFVEKHKTFFESVQPSFFELTTGMAFAYFAEQKVDIAVIEVGLGGRLDCTNMISPVLSIITNISLDHTNLLGSTEEAIAKEKAGIIKPNVPVIIGEAEGKIRQIFMETSDSLNNKNIVFAQDKNPIQSSQLLPSGYWEFETLEYPELIDELGGYAQEKNAATVLSAVSILKKQSLLNIPPKAVYKGFRFVVENTGLAGRWQTIQYNPKIVLDTGHNEAGIKYIVQQLEQESYDKLHIVFGMVNDKDFSAVLRLLPKNAHYYFTQPAIPRALPSDELAQKAEKYNLKGNLFPNVAAAFSAAKENSSKKDFIFVGGSTFVVADALSFIQKNQLKT